MEFLRTIIFCETVLLSLCNTRRIQISSFLTDFLQDHMIRQIILFFNDEGNIFQSSIKQIGYFYTKFVSEDDKINSASSIHFEGLKIPSIFSSRGCHEHTSTVSVFPQLELLSGILTMVPQIFFSFQTSDLSYY